MRKLLLLALITTAFPVSAQLADRNWYFQDTTSGMYWLKLTETVGLSYEHAEDMTLPGRELEGWRIATLEELEQLALNVGIERPVSNSCSTMSCVCTSGTFCGDIDKAYGEQLELLIKAFGDTKNLEALSKPYASYNALAAAPYGAWASLGYLDGWGSNNPESAIKTTTIFDGELVDRNSGAFWANHTDRIITVDEYLNGGPANRGTYMVRDTDPRQPLPARTDITIDFAPGDATNTLNLGTGGGTNATFAVLGARTSLGATTDITPGTGSADDIDAFKLRIGPAGTPKKTGAVPVISDVNGDALDDMTITFDVNGAGITCFNNNLVVTGEKLSGETFIASDSITTENCENSCHP